MTTDRKIAAIIPAAGVGRRMAAPGNKIWLTLNGRSILEQTCHTLLESGLFKVMVIVANPNELEMFADWPRNFGRTSIYVTAGGRERRDSVARGLQFLEGLAEWRGGARLVAIHDAVRALVTPELLEQAVAAGWRYRAAAVGVPVKDTIKRVDEAGFVMETPERSTLWAVQTPQVFEYDLIKECYQKIAETDPAFSDDCGVAEFNGISVKLIMGSHENIKITTPEDLIFAEAILRRRTNAGRAGI